MLLYKFRSLQKIEFCLDIILNERLHCAPYSELNDPFEGLFHTIISSPGFNKAFSLAYATKKIKACKTIEDLHIGFENSRICSLSRSLDEIRLWSYYADGHKGIAIEIDFSENGKDIYEIMYGPKLPEFGNTILGGPLTEDVLSYKTDHWKHEAEYRIIQNENYYPITGRIKSIFTGHRISNFHLELLEKVVPPQIQIIPAEINTEKLIVQPIKAKTASRQQPKET